MRQANFSHYYMQTGVWEAFSAECPRLNATRGLQGVAMTSAARSWRIRQPLGLARENKCLIQMDECESQCQTHLQAWDPDLFSLHPSFCFSSSFHFSFSTEQPVIAKCMSIHLVYFLSICMSMPPCLLTSYMRSVHKHFGQRSLVISICPFSCDEVYTAADVGSLGWWGIAYFEQWIIAYQARFILLWINMHFLEERFIPRP